MDEAPQILYRDGHLLVIDKPSGWAVHRTRGRPTRLLVDFVRELLGVATVHPAHRLDAGTSGPVVFALDAGTARQLGEQFHSGAVHKSYLALVRGAPSEAGLIDHPLPRQPDGPPVPSRTRYALRHTAGLVPHPLSLVACWPSTGRRHQLRRHLEHIGHPILGDTSYGKGKLNRAATRRWGLKRLALHASSVQLNHPLDGQPRNFVAPLPDDLRGPLGAMGFPDESLADVAPAE